MTSSRRRANIQRSINQLKHSSDILTADIKAWRLEREAIRKKEDAITAKINGAVGMRDEAGKMLLEHYAELEKLSTDLE